MILSDGLYDGFFRYTNEDYNIFLHDFASRISGCKYNATSQDDRGCGNFRRYAPFGRKHLAYSGLFWSVVVCSGLFCSALVCSVWGWWATFTSPVCPSPSRLTSCNVGTELN